MLEVLSEKNTAKFLSFLVKTERSKEYPMAVLNKDRKILPRRKDTDGHFAFLMHPIDLKNYKEFDQSLSVFADEEISQHASKWNSMIEPFVISETRIETQCGASAYGEFIVIPRTAAQLINMPRQKALEELRAGIRLARKRGAYIVGLGAFTSVVSAGGLYLQEEGIPLTTGNSYTVVSAVDAIISALEKLHASPEESCAAVVGALGKVLPCFCLKL